MTDMKTFTDLLEAQAKHWQQQAADIQSRLPNLNDDLKQQYEKQVATINEYAAKTQDMLGKVRTANEAAWKDMADGAARSFEEWQKAVQSAMSRFKV